MSAICFSLNALNAALSFPKLPQCPACPVLLVLLALPALPALPVCLVGLQLPVCLVSLRLLALLQLPRLALLQPLVFPACLVVRSLPDKRKNYSKKEPAQCGFFLVAVFFQILITFSSMFLTRKGPQSRTLPRR